MSETRGPAFTDVERQALGAAEDARIVSPATIAMVGHTLDSLSLLMEVIEARLTDIESRFEARVTILENRLLNE